jgi:hypothetical protein
MLLHSNHIAHVNQLPPLFFLLFCDVAAHWQSFTIEPHLAVKHNIKVKRLKYPFMLNLAIYAIYKKTLAEYKIKKTMCDTNKKSCFANTSES